jgi:hypothetical protein
MQYMLQQFCEDGPYARVPVSTPNTIAAEAGPEGLHPLELGDARDGLLYVPSSYQENIPAYVSLGAICRLRS